MKNINAITTAVFLNNSKTAMAATVWQYDYGMKLRLQGLHLPAAVEVHFSAQETRGEAITRVGTTQDGVTDVTIPDSLLENDDATRNYLVYAFVYLTDETSGQTEYKVTIPVNSRPRPAGRNKPEEAELFRQAIDAVNTAADRAEAAGTTAQSWATGGTDTRDGEDTDNAKYYAQQAQKAVDDAAEAFKGSAEQIEENAAGIKTLKEDIDVLPDFGKTEEMDGFIITDSEENVAIQFGSKKHWDDLPYNRKYGFGGYPYGNGVLPPFSRIAGVFEADMLSVKGGKGRWNGNDTGNFDHGGHVFEGWNAEEDVRLTAGIGLNNKNIAWLQTFHPATEEGTDGGAYYGITKIGSDIDTQGVDFLPKVAQCCATLVLWTRPTSATPTIPVEQLDMLIDTGEIPSSIVNKTDLMIWGGMYYDSTLDRIRVYTKNGWKTLSWEVE